MSNSSKPWQPGFLRLPVHSRIKYQLQLGMDGKENTLLVGPRGVGKTFAVTTLLEEINAEESQKLSSFEQTPRRGFYLAASEAKGSRTILVDLKQAITRREVSAGARRTHTPSYMIETIVAELINLSIHLLVIDEAQLVNAANLDLLRQIPDCARQRNHTLGIVYVGNDGLRASLVAIGQLGQRVSHEIRLEPITESVLMQYLSSFHPDLETLKEAIPAKTWKQLVGRLFQATGGNHRRMSTVLLNADDLARRKGSPIDTKILELAMHKLAPEA
jgi:type II secretory pathway predicted ATPase ExeA